MNIIFFNSVVALRPNLSSPDQVDENFSQWKQPLVQHALSEVVVICLYSSFLN